MAIDISHAVADLKDDFSATDALVDDIYNKYFAKYFIRTKEFETAFQNKVTPITDEQLEDIMVGLPLDLIQVSNSLAQFKQHQEIVKLTIKQRKKLKSNLPEDADMDTEYALMSIVYSSVITMVEGQISFSKELIMSAKKVWDARKRTETVSPIKETSIELPNYSSDILETGGSKHVPIF